jgi:hypothetical protein
VKYCEGVDAIACKNRQFNNWRELFIQRKVSVTQPSIPPKNQYAAKKVELSVLRDIGATLNDDLDRSELPPKEIVARCV